MRHLVDAQQGAAQQWGIRQKQTGADRLSIGGALAANAHGRGLLFKPFVGDVESFVRSEEHTSELQSRLHLVCRLLLEKKNNDRASQPNSHSPTCHRCEGDDVLASASPSAHPRSSAPAYRPPGTGGTRKRPPPRDSRPP